MTASFTEENLLIPLFFFIATKIVFYQFSIILLFLKMSAAIA